MKKRTFVESVNNAIEGFIYVVKNEKNMRVHFLIGFLVLLGGVLLRVTRIEWIALSITVTLVWAAEMFNTLIEETMDFMQDAFHPAVRVIKDVSAGIVLVCVINSLVVGFLIFSKYGASPWEIFTTRFRYGSWDILFAALLAVVFIVILVKAYFHRGTPLRGGIISGHAAVAFSLWTAVLYLQESIFITAAALLLALLVVQARMRAKIHTFWEVAGGALLGIVVTALFFQAVSVGGVMFEKIRNHFMSGLLILGPVFLTVVCIGYLVKLTDSFIVDPLFTMLPFEINAHSKVLLAKLALAFVVVVFIAAVGLAGEKFLFRRLFQGFDGFFKNVPLFNTFYGSIKEVAQAFFGDKRGVFRRVVFLEYPRKGIYAMGFVTQEKRWAIHEKTGKENIVSVFVPSPPNPATGMFVFAPADELVETDLTIEEGIRIVISGGAAVPPLKKI